MLTGGVLLQGVMSVSWCKHEASYLLSSGKDGKVILWDAPQGRALGAFSVGLPGVTAHQVRWSPASPGLFAIATMGGPDGHGKVTAAGTLIPLCWTPLPSADHTCKRRNPATRHRALMSIRAGNDAEAQVIASNDLPGPPMEAPCC